MTAMPDRFSPKRLPPHPATVVQPKPAFAKMAKRLPPHPATVVQPKPAFAKMTKRLPSRPATVAQSKPAFTRGAVRPPHPAAVGVSRAPAGIRAARGAVAQRMMEEEPTFDRNGWRAIFLQFLMPEALSFMGMETPHLIQNLLEDYERDWDRIAQEHRNADGLVLLKNVTAYLARQYAENDWALADSLIASLGQALAKGTYLEPSDEFAVADFWLQLRRELTPKEVEDRNQRLRREYDPLLDLEALHEEATHLFLGEGDFTFTQFLGRIGLGEHILASTNESKKDVKKYTKADPAIKDLDRLGARVHFKLDARDIKVDKSEMMTRVVFNFPYVPQPQRSQTSATKEMLQGMVKSAAQALMVGGELHITIVDSDWWESRLVTPLNAVLWHNGFELREVVAFNEKDFVGYEHRKSHKDTSAKSTKGSLGKTFIYLKRR
ncbi:Rossmann-like fold-containing protein [Sorangium sp. So ce1128]